MEHTEIINGAFTFTKNAFIGWRNLRRWIKLFLFSIVPAAVGYVVSTILFQFLLHPILVRILVNDNFGFTPGNISYILKWCSFVIALLCLFFVPLLQGYAYRIFKSGDEMPSTDNTLGLFFSGWRVNLVLFCYAIPLIVISIIYMALFIHVVPNALSYVPAPVLSFNELVSGAAMFAFATIEFITFIFVGLFAIVALVHVARAGSLREAIKFRKMAGIISKIGWYDYILSLVIMSIMFMVISVVFILISQLITTMVGLTILLLVYYFVMIPVLTLFIKYMTEVYDTAFFVEEDDDADFDDF